MPFATRLRPLLTACLFLVALLPLRAENWQTFTVIAPAARAQHAFTLQLNGVPHGSVSFGGEIQAWGDELAVPLTLSVDLDQTGPFTLLDTGVGEFVPLAAWWPGPPELGVGYISEHDFRPSGGQPPTRSFFVPEARRDHSLFLSQPGGGASLSVNGSSPIPYYSPTLLTTAGYEGRALFDPTLPYRITDLNTGEQTPFFATDLAYAVWSPGTGDVPMVLVTLYLEGREDAHRFTVHSRAVGGPVIVQSVQAHDGMGGMGGMGAAWPAGGGWTCGTGWSWFEVPAGSAMLSFAVGRGMEFWITREADSPPIASPHFAADDSSGAPLAWPLYGVFPIPVQRATQAVTFRVNAQRWGNQFTVWQSDGYHFRFGDSMNSYGTTNWQGQNYTRETITNWNEQGLYNPLEILTFTANLDPTRAWWLVDDAGGYGFGGSNGYNYPQTFPSLQADVFDGWSPQHVAPPADADLTISIRLPASLLSSQFRLLGASGEVGYYSGYPVPSVETETIAGLDNLPGFELQSFTLTFPNPTPYVDASFTLEGGWDGSNPYSHTVTGGGNDLRLSFRPLVPLLLNISNSRWDHELLIRHPEGTTFAIQKGQTQGITSFDENLQAWVTSYYYFDATAVANPEMPWYVEDASTGERRGPNPTDADLINWIALADPKNLTKQENADGTFALTWTFSETSTDAAFKLERRESDSEPWQTIDTFPAAETLNTSTHLAHARTALAASQPGKTASIRVFYEYGSQRSAPSNTVPLPNADTDGDDLPDWWERLWSLDPNDPLDGTLWNVNAGGTAKDLYGQGATPGSGGPPTADDWKISRLSLWQTLGSDNNAGAGSVLTWDGNIKDGTQVIIEREHVYGSWAPVKTVAATERYVFIRDDDHEDPDFLKHARSGEGRAEGEEPNFRLRGAYASNESVRRVRFMVRHAGVSRTQPGIQEFDGPWFTGSPPSRKYYRHAEWRMSDHSSNDDGSSASGSGNGQWTYEPASNFHYWSENYHHTSHPPDDPSGPGDSYHKWSSVGLAYPRDLSTAGWGYIDSGTEYTNADGTTYGDGTIGSATFPLHHGPYDGDLLRQDWSFGANTNPMSEWHDIDGTTTTDSLAMPFLDVPLPIYGNTARDQVTLRDGPDGPDPTAGSWSKWSLTLNQEYTATQFFDDTKQLLPAAPASPGWKRLLPYQAGGSSAYTPGLDYFNTMAEHEEWPASWWAGTRGGGGGHHHISDESFTAITSWRITPANLARVSLSRSDWWLECNDCLPGQPVTVIEYEQDYDIEGDSTPLGARKPIRILSITPGSKPGLVNETAKVSSDVTGAAGNRRRYIERLPVQLLVDASRDGNLDEHDVTSKEHPYRFWLNDDDDANEKDHPESGSKDFNSNTIISQRDLEDFTRLHISIGAMQDSIASGTITVSLEWRNVAPSASPSIKLFAAAENDGGTAYLTSDSTAANQWGSTAVGTASAGGVYHFPASLWREDPLSSRVALSAANPNRYMIFEGCAKGKGELVMSFWKGGQKLGEGPSVWINLLNVREMFQRARITVEPTSIPDPWNSNAANSPQFVSVEDRLGQALEPDPDETKECIVYVHGWRMKYWESINWAETSYKRLWHQGYKGRFASFRWPTLSGDSSGVNGYATYNASEYRAWLSGPALANYINNTPNVPDDYRKLVFAHSMGNVVMASALREGAIPERYAILNGAMAAMAYDDSIVDSPQFITPDTADGDPATLALGLKRKVQDAVDPSKTTLINMGLFVPNISIDFALGLWDINNAQKPQAWVGWTGSGGYHYNWYRPAGLKLTFDGIVSVRGITNIPEAMGYGTQSRSRPIGSHQEVIASGISAPAINLRDSDYNFGSEHSAEWNFTVQRTYMFWTKLLQRLENKRSNITQ